MEGNLKLLLCEDDENLGFLLRDYLRSKGYETDLYPDGESGYKGFLKGQYDLCILDVMMPKKDGLTLSKEIRVVNPEIPVILLTAKTMRDDITEGFKSGVDDYMTKPFSLEELVFRIGAILRRAKSCLPQEQHIYRFSTTVFDTQKLILTVNGESTKLTTKEGELLALLCFHANGMLERSKALKQIWNGENYYNARSMDVYITKLRKLLKADPGLEIVNIHGKGYKLLAAEETAGNPECL